MLFSSNAKSQLLRTWTYSYNPVGNYESSGNSIVSLPSGNAVTAGVYTATTGSRKNTLLLTDASGMLLQEDTSVIGFGYRKIIYDGNAHIYSAATLTNDSLPVSKIVVAKFDTAFGVRRFFVPDSSTTFPIYDVQDFALLVNERIVVASHWDAFPFVCLSLTCMDSSGSVLWERIDSSFQFETSNIGILKYDLSGLINSNNSDRVQEIEIFPNPSTGKFRIRLDNISDGKTGIRIYSTMGIEVMRDELPARYREKDYDLAFSSGLYYVILETGKGKSTRIISIAD